MCVRVQQGVGVEDRGLLGGKYYDEGGTKGAAFVRSGQVGVGATVVLQTIDSAHYRDRAHNQSWLPA